MSKSLKKRNREGILSIWRNMSLEKYQATAIQLAGDSSRLVRDLNPEIS
jgi:hypothetical protein